MNDMFIPRSNDKSLDRYENRIFIPESDNKLLDRYENRIFIPRETILQIIDELDIEDLEPFFIVNRDLTYYSNDPLILKYIAEKYGLPYVSSFSNLLYLYRMTFEQIYVYAYDIGDTRIMDYYSDKGGYILPYTLSINRFDIAYYIYENLSYIIPTDIFLGDEAITNAVNNEEWSILEYLLFNYEAKTPYLASLAAAKLGDIHIFRDLFYVYDNELIDAATEYGNLNIVKELLKFGSGNALEIAVKNGDLTMVLYLINHGESREQARELAIKYGQDEILEEI